MATTIRDSTKRGRRGLADVQGSIAKEFAKITAEEARKTLDTKITFIPLDIRTIRLTLKGLISEEDQDPDTGLRPVTNRGLKQFVERIIAWVDKEVSTYKYTIELGKPEGIFVAVNGGKPESLGTSSITQFLPAKITKNDRVLGLMFPSATNKARQDLFKNFLNKELSKLIYEQRYDQPDPNYPALAEVTKNFTRQFDLGHLLSGIPITNSAGQQVDLATSPQAERIKKLLTEIGTKIAGATDPQQLKKLQQFETEVFQLQQELYAKSTFGPKILVNLDKDVRGFLIETGALVTIIQERVENQYKYGLLLEGRVGTGILDLLLDLGYSSNILEDLDDIFAQALTKGVSSIVRKGKQSFEFSLTGTKPPKISNSQSIQLTKPKSNTIKQQVKVSSSAISLKDLLNAQLVQTIKQNMGTGSRRDILNLRSGRFAESVQVTNVSEGRSGMISAFYTYMRNPYATFSMGGKQQLPRSRDPKLLISSSIRQIAKQLAITKIRSIEQ